MTGSHEQIQAGGDGAALAGLARELEQLHREVRDLREVPQRVDELAAALAYLAETVALTGQQSQSEAAPCWLDHPVEPSVAARLLGHLAGWVETVYLRYSDAVGGLPDCWMRHPDVVEELLWLHRAWQAAYAAGAPATAIGDWHDRQRPGVVARTRGYSGTCSLDAHRAGHDQHVPASGAVTGDAIEVIAGWWATARDQPAPVPTEEQLGAARERHRRTRR